MKLAAALALLSGCASTPYLGAYYPDTCRDQLRQCDAECAARPRDPDTIPVCADCQRDAERCKQASDAADAARHAGR